MGFSVLLLLWSVALAAQPLTLEGAVEHALNNNPGLKALWNGVLASRHRPSQVGALPDPRLTFRAVNLPAESFDPGLEPMSQLQIGFSQRFPFPGKLSLKEEAARLEVEIAKARFREARLQLIFRVKRLWWRLFALDRSLEKLGEARQLLRQFLKVAEVRYRVGQGLQQDVLLAQLELSRLVDREWELLRERRDLAAELNALLDRPAAAAVQLPREVALRFPERIDRKRLEERAFTTRPLLLAARLEIARAERQLALAKRDLFPDVTLSAAYGVRTRFRDFATLGITIDLPLYASKKQLQAIRERARERERRYHRLREAVRRIGAEIETALNDFQKAREQLELLESSILPQARQTVASMLAAYQVGKVDFLNLVRAELLLLEHQIDYYRRLAEVETAIARLAAAIGVEEIQP